MDRAEYISPVEQKKPKCPHAHARVTTHCRDCGKETRSHRLEETMLVKTECPDCGTVIEVEVHLFQCHMCYEKERVPEELP